MAVAYLGLPNLNLQGVVSSKKSLCHSCMSPFVCSLDLFFVSSYAAYAYMELFTYYASEEAGSVEVCVVVAGQLNSSAVIVLKTYPRTATCEFDAHCYAYIILCHSYIC